MYPPYAGGFSNISCLLSFRRLAEDGYQSPKPDIRAEESSSDDRDRKHIGRQQQARPRDGDAIGPMERDNYFRQGSFT